MFINDFHITFLMTSGKRKDGFMRIAVMAVVLFTVIVFTFSFSMAGNSTNHTNTMSVTPSVVQNQTEYKYQWMNDTSSVAPVPVSNSSMACFTPDKEAIMFGGMTVVNETVTHGKNTSYKLVNKTMNQTWIYNSQTWTKLTTSSSIPGLLGTSMNFYPRGEDIVLFGGENLTSSGKLVVTNQTWIFTGFTWTPLRGILKAPSARAFAASAYSSSIGSIVLFGGKTANGYSNSTWIFKDNAWTVMKTNGSIPAMEGSTMEALPDGNMILYGGYNGTYSSATWMLNVTTKNWTQINLSTNPGALAFSHLKYFSFNNFLLLYGGVNTKGTPTDQSWSFSPVTMTWSQLNIKAPKSEYGQSMSILNANSTIVLFGGASSSVYGSYINYTYQFQNNTYNWVEFEESGLPTNSTWGIKLGSTSINTTSNEVEFLVMAGTYNYTTFAPSGYTGASGSITMYASFITQSILFSKIPTLFYYTYGIIAGIVIVVLTYLGSLVYRKLIK